MSKIFRVWLFLLVTGSSFMLLPVSAAESGEGNLVNVQWLEQNVHR